MILQDKTQQEGAQVTPAIPLWCLSYHSRRSNCRRKWEWIYLSGSREPPIYKHWSPWPTVFRRKNGLPTRTNVML